MANQRLGFKCICGAELFVAKRFGEAFYSQPAVPTEKMDEFFEEHAWCSNTLDHFEITYELERGYDFKRVVKRVASVS